jgi:NADP-dependent 3-hydroxy acid dehydrogenase YdfG
MSAPSPSAAVGLPDLGLGGSAVIVTGAGSGIGAAAARRLGAAGASVVLVGRRMALLETVAGAITSGGGRSTG